MIEPVNACSVSDDGSFENDSDNLKVVMNSYINNDCGCDSPIIYTEEVAAGKFMDGDGA